MRKKRPSEKNKRSKNRKKKEWHETQSNKRVSEREREKRCGSVRSSKREREKVSSKWSTVIAWIFNSHVHTHRTHASVKCASVYSVHRLLCRSIVCVELRCKRERERETKS